jgi:hypothetical protein
MKRLLVCVVLFCLSPVGPCADKPPVLPRRIGTTADFRQLLLGTKWMWRNVEAGVPDRQCVFMDDGTFRHPHFVAQFTITDIQTVELHKKGKKAVLNFAADYRSFEAIDFDKHRITGKRE